VEPASHGSRPLGITNHRARSAKPSARLPTSRSRSTRSPPGGWKSAP